MTAKYTASSTLFYQWHQYRCAYNVSQIDHSPLEEPSLFLIHPIGVGLSRVN